MAKPSSTSPFKAMEEEACHAFLEWPVWLVLREKELAAYLAADRPVGPKNLTDASILPYAASR